MAMFAGADAYDQFMGRYSSPLAPQMADLAEIAEGGRALDVGCGPGALTSELMRRLGAEAVAAVDPSPSFIEAVTGRYPGVDARLGVVEHLPFDDRAFDATLAQLVVHFLADPVQGLAEMRRVTGPGGVVAACVWDHAGRHGPLSVFWEAARHLDAGVVDESRLPGVREGHLAAMFRAAGLDQVEEASLWISVEHPTFEDWWEPFTLGVGPAGAYVAGLAPDERRRLEALCRRLLPPAPFTIQARAWAARGRA